MQKIFVPVDGSGCSERATKHAVALAKQLGRCAKKEVLVGPIAGVLTQRAAALGATPLSWARMA